MMRPLLFEISLLLLLGSSIAKTLYSDLDPLWQLNTTNFNQKVLNKDHAWIIEFYSSWCGHCIRFAPTWKLFAQEIRTWKNVIKVGAVNCNDPENIGLCRQYEVTMYPTIKLFWRNANETYLGEVMGGNRDIDNMEDKVIDFLESHWEEGVPSEWPEIPPVATNSLVEMTSSIPENKQSMMLFIEQPDVYTGRKVILDLSWQQNVIMKRILTTNERLMKDLNFKVATDTVPSVIRIFRNNFQLPLFKYSYNHTANYIRDQVFKLVIGTERNLTKIEDFFPVKTTTTTPAPIIEVVYMTDLENAIHYLLNQEIGVTKSIKGDKLSVVKSFLFVLKTHFPGSPPVMAYLSTLYNWVSHKEHFMSGEEFVQAMEQMQRENEYLPKMQDWVGCKGSEPQFRGYPCSLWRLFHTLTVQANYEQQQYSSSTGSGKVLFTIRDYIKNFFSCSECSAHFAEMAINVEKEVNSTRDAVLWLWEAHNKVNRRLSGDVTEDPKHPKVQFPTLTACPSCQSSTGTSGEIMWDRDVVLKFLHQFYGRTNIRTKDQEGPISSDQSPNLNSSAMVLKFFSPLIQLFFCYCFTTFVSFWMYFGPCDISIGKSAD